MLDHARVARPFVFFGKELEGAMTIIVSLCEEVARLGSRGSANAHQG